MIQVYLQTRLSTVILQEICKKIYFYAILPSLVTICNATIVIITIILQIIYTSDDQVYINLTFL